MFESLAIMVLNQHLVHSEYEFAVRHEDNLHKLVVADDKSDFGPSDLSYEEWVGKGFYYLSRQFIIRM